MIACDLSRAVLVAIMAMPGMPMILMVCIFGVVTTIGAPFTSARAALYPDILPGILYCWAPPSRSRRPVAQVIGFAAGGAMVGLFGVRTSLLTDAATFIVSALITRVFVRARPAARTRFGSRLVVVGSHRRDPAVFGNPALRTPMLLGWLVAFYNVPEGVVAPLSGRWAAGMWPRA